MDYGLHFKGYQFSIFFKRAHRTKDAQKINTSTQYYNHIEEMMYQSQNDNFSVRIANTMEDAIKLMEVGFEFHAEIESQ